MQIFYRWFYHRLPIQLLETDGNIYLLNEAEVTRLKNMETWAVCFAAFFGAMGVVLLYVPNYFYPSFFQPTIIIIGNIQLPVPIIFTLWSIVLVGIELVLLTLLHIYCIHQMAVATGFLQYEHKQNDQHTQLLLSLGLDRKDTSVERYGIDPLAEMNKKAILVWNLFISLKATLSNILFKFVIQRMLGRYAFQWVKDMSGIPVFAAWNAWGTLQVLRQGRLVIMGQNLVEHAFYRIKEAWPEISPHEQLIFSTLQFIATSKQDYHYNHTILTRLMVEHYQIATPIALYQQAVFIDNLKAAPEDVKVFCKWLIAIGFILDGHMSSREKNVLLFLEKEALAPASWLVMKDWCKRFMEGKGWEGLPLRANTAGFALQ